MEKYKFRATVCFVFLIVSLLVATLFAWIAIRESKKSITLDEKKEVLKDSNINNRELCFEEATNTVNRALTLVGGTEFFNNIFSSSTCNEIHFDLVEDIFTKEAIDKLKAKATLKNDIYVDCNNTYKNNFYGVFKHAFTNDAFKLDLVSLDYESETIVLTDGVDFVVLKHVDNKWLIDLF